ncbi:MAG: patatin, partial [Hyphomicrobiales bacterium]
MSEEPRITAQNPTTPGSPRPKRILAIDGGGVRGIVAIGFLERMEAALQDATGNQQLLLADHFDLIGGTSVGSMIATMLALGRPTDRVAATFKEVAPKIFRRQIGEGIFVPQFSARDLEQVLLRELGDMRLDDPKLRTGLAIIIKRLDTGSPWWIMTNNPGGKFWESDGQQTIADLIRASTAAPTVFEPKELPLAVGGPGLFVDGGLTPFNNPSLALLMAA